MVDGFILRILADACWYLSLIFIFIPKNIVAYSLVAIPFVIYVIALLVVKKGRVDYLLYGNIFKAQTFIYLFVSIIASLYTTKGRVPMYLFGLAFMVFAVLALRLNRLGRAARVKGRLWNAVVVGGLLFGTALLWLASEGIRVLFWKAISYVREALVFEYTYQQAEEAHVRVEYVETGKGIASGNYGNGSRYHGSTSTVKNVEDPLPAVDKKTLLTIIIIVFLVIVGSIVLLIIIKLFRKMQSEKLGDAYCDYFEDAEHKKKSKNKIARDSNKSQIRKIYHDYLRLVMARGLVVKPRITSLDVLNYTVEDANKISDENMELSPDEELRELYISIRYRTEGSVTDEELRKAKELFKKIKEHTK